MLEKANSSICIVAYMRQWFVLALVQIKGCGVYGAKPLSDPMLHNWQLDPWTQSSVKFIQIFSFMKKHLKISSAKWRPFCPDGDNLNHVSESGPYMDVIGRYQTSKFFYCQISNMSRTKPQNLHVPIPALQLSLLNPVKPGVKSRMKM